MIWYTLIIACRLRRTNVFNFKLSLFPPLPSRQFTTGIGCGCKCRVAPSDEIKAMKAASGGGNRNTMRPWRSFKRDKKDHEDETRMEKKKFLKKEIEMNKEKENEKTQMKMEEMRKKEKKEMMKRVE